MAKAKSKTHVFSNPSLVALSCNSVWQSTVSSMRSFERRALAAMILIDMGVTQPTVGEITALNNGAIDALAEFVLENPSQKGTVQ